MQCNPDPTFNYTYQCNGGPCQDEYISIKSTMQFGGKNVTGSSTKGGVTSGFPRIEPTGGAPVSYSVVVPAAQTSAFYPTQAQDSRSLFINSFDPAATYDQVINCPNKYDAVGSMSTLVSGNTRTVVVTKDLLSASSQAAGIPMSSCGVTSSTPVSDFWAVPPNPMACPSIGSLPSEKGFTNNVDDVTFPNAPSYNAICDGTGGITQYCNYNMTKRIPSYDTKTICSLLNMGTATPQGGCSAPLPSDTYELPLSNGSLFGDYVLGKYCTQVSTTGTCPVYLDTDPDSSTFGQRVPSKQCTNFVIQGVCIDYSQRMTSTAEALTKGGSGLAPGVTNPTAQLAQYNALVTQNCVGKSPNDFQECQCQEAASTAFYQQLAALEKGTSSAAAAAATQLLSGDVNCWFKPCQLARESVGNLYLTQLKTTPITCPNNICVQVIDIHDNTDTNINIHNLNNIFNCPLGPTGMTGQTGGTGNTGQTGATGPSPTPSFWERYKWWIVGTIIVVVVIVIIIIGISVAQKKSIAGPTSSPVKTGEIEMKVMRETG